MKCLVSGLCGSMSSVVVCSPKQRKRGGRLHTVSHEASEVTAHDAVPGGPLPLVELCIRVLRQRKVRGMARC